MTKEPDAEQYLQQIPLWTKKKNSLEDIRAFLEEMGNPDDSMQIIHVAGTNGKGSVCAFLTSILIEAGYRVGTFTSPHLMDVRERFQINGTMVEPPEFEESFLAVYRLAMSMVSKGYCHPSYFEFLFYMGMVLFSGSSLNYVILETGLGGRLDTTNVIRKPAVEVITSISMDHMEYLGNTIALIASEKAGIIKNGIPLVYDNNDKEAAAMIQAKARAMNACTYPVGNSDFSIINQNTDGISARGKTIDGTQMKLQLPFAAPYQVMNGLLSLRTAEVLNRHAHCHISEDAMAEGIRKTRWGGRMEQVLPGVYLDGAHNAGGVDAFTEAAAKLLQVSTKKARLLFAAVSDKEYSKMIHHICKNLPLEGVTVVHIDNSRSLETQAMTAEFEHASDCPVSGFPTVEEGVAYALASKGADDLLFCVGSLYLIGEIKTVLRRNKYD